MLKKISLTLALVAATVTASAGVGTGSADDRRARRQEDLSILDFVRESANRLRSRLGASDRVRLTDYLDSVREIERRMRS